MKKPHFAFSHVPALVNAALSQVWFTGDKPVIPSVWRKGKTQLCVVVGDNASGKSFFRRVVSAVCSQATKKTEYIPISMEGRRNTAMNIGLSFVYGDESYRATGELSANTVLMGIKTSQGRESRHVIFWDEPDLGLSDAWAAGLGKRLAEFAKEPPKHLVAAFVATHNKSLVAQLLDVEPHYLHLGESPETAPQRLVDWFERPVVPRDIDELAEQSRRRFKAIQKLFPR